MTRACLGFYERGPGTLQLRFGALDNEGLCDEGFEEGPLFITVRLVLCSSEDEGLGYRGLAEERTHVDLEQPLNGRAVLDVVTGRPVPFFVPAYWDDRPTKAPGYYSDRAEALAAATLGPKRARQQMPLRGGLPQSRTLSW